MGISRRVGFALFSQLWQAGVGQVKKFPVTVENWQTSMIKYEGKDAKRITMMVIWCECMINNNLGVFIPCEENQERIYGQLFQGTEGTLWSHKGGTSISIRRRTLLCAGLLCCFKSFEECRITKVFGTQFSLVETRTTPTARCWKSIWWHHDIVHK